MALCDECDCYDDNWIDGEDITEEELEKETFFIPKSILKSKSKLDKREPTNKNDKKRTKRVFIVDPTSQKSSRKNVTRKI